jgi:hypothetical protein
MGHKVSRVHPEPRSIYLDFTLRVAFLSTLRFGLSTFVHTVYDRIESDGISYMSATRVLRY